MNYKLSTSILAADVARLGEELDTVIKAGADYIHIDIMDGMFVNNISFGIPVIEGIRGCTDTFFDVHLMVQEPIRYVREFAYAGSDGITVHAEACDNLEATIDEIIKAGKKPAVAIKPMTDIDGILHILPKIYMVLIMTVEPGYGGQKIRKDTFDKIRRLLRNGAVFAVHIVLLDLVLLDRSERAEPDVQRHIADADALGSDPLQKLRREVQSRRGSRRRAVDLGVDSLVALLVLQLLLDVRRQRHFAEPLEHLKEDAIVIEAHQTVAVRQDLGDLRRQLAVAEAHPRTLAQVLARTYKALPHLIALVLQQQHLAGSAAGQTVSQQSRRQNAGIVQNQAVAGPQKIRQLIKVVV